VLGVVIFAGFLLKSKPECIRAVIRVAERWATQGARAQRSERELTVHGWGGGPQSSAAIRDFAQDVDERGRRAQRSESKRNVRGWGRGAIWRDRSSRITTAT